MALNKAMDHHTVTVGQLKTGSTMYKQAFIQNRVRIFLLALAIVTTAMLSLIFAKPTHAQEINPAPGSYSYGSTSEFSPYATLGQGTNGGGGSESLASTGQNQMLGYLAVGLLLIGAGAVAYYTLRKRKHGSTTKTDQAS